MANNALKIRNDTTIVNPFTWFLLTYIKCNVCLRLEEMHAWLSYGPRHPRPMKLKICTCSKFIINWAIVCKAMDSLGSRVIYGLSPHQPE